MSREGARAAAYRPNDYNVDDSQPGSSAFHAAVGPAQHQQHVQNGGKQWGQQLSAAEKRELHRKQMMKEIDQMENNPDGADPLAYSGKPRQREQDDSSCFACSCLMALWVTVCCCCLGGDGGAGGPDGGIEQ
eukprot:TRINITY_DN67807_c3_g12_i1.p1 TRINITY_DN67807_c3_g12~~TRINITY_DN67807_c3_g12_i1.p1  ORF type:complete len:132 (+),score=65.97 TRINITY_DN67807_c3_g12_i1:191-586(+)